MTVNPQQWAPPAPRPTGALPWLPPQNHPRSTLALILGILGVTGLVIVVTLPLGPLAWYFGARSMRDIDRDPARWGGRGAAQAGLIMGIIASGLLLVAMMFAALMLVGVAVISGVDSGYGT